MEITINLETYQQLLEAQFTLKALKRAFEKKGMLFTSDVYPVTGWEAKEIEVIDTKGE